MSYFGGKGQDGVYQTVINQIPVHELYVEAFFGGGSIMKRKRPASQSIGLDMDNLAINAFPVHSIPNLSLINQCGIEFIENFNGSNWPDSSFIYCDPPYMPETRISNAKYNCELTESDHVRLLTALQHVNCRAAISTYPVPLYEKMLSDWRTIEFTSVDRGGNVRTEVLFMNYPEPEVLHDDRYLGEDKDKRQRIKRQIDRTAEKLISWDSQKRARLLMELLPNITESERKLISSAVADNYCAR